MFMRFIARTCTEDLTLPRFRHDPGAMGGSEGEEMIWNGLSELPRYF